MRFGLSDKKHFLLATLMLATVSAAHAGEIEDRQTIGLFSEEQPVVAASPIPRPVSKIAENVTVITADDILRINAHTLAEVLQTVPGIQLDVGQRSPGAAAFFNIQGATNTTVLVLIDGIRQNDFDQDVAWPSRIPVQQIERIEIVKGAASGSWGSALGGVVNIVTKSPNPERAASGLVSGSIGSRFTADSRGELSGTKDRFGYYLTAGRLRSDGLTADSDARLDNLYGKLTYTLPSQGTATVGVSQQTTKGGEGEGFIPPLGVTLRNDSNSRHSYGFVKFQQPLANRFSFDFQGYLTGRREYFQRGLQAGAAPFVTLNDFRLEDSTGGINTSLSWGDLKKNVTIGGEYLHGRADIRDLLTTNPPFYDRSWDSFAAYCNGTFSVGALSVLPGVRFDSTGISGNQKSYTLGLTYQLADNTTLRAYAAKGFSLPMLVNDTGAQKVWTVQGGVETGAVPFLWLKGTYFYNHLHNAEATGIAGAAAVSDQDREGFEIEARTAPFFGFALTGAYTYLHAVTEDPDHRLQTNSGQTVPPQVYKAGLRYDDAALGLRGSLTGSGAVWNAEPGFIARSDFMLWDASFNWKPCLKRASSPELFFSVHNIFGGQQTTNTWMAPSAGRWYEGGARFSF